MNSKQPQSQLASNISEEAVKALSLLPVDEQRNVLDYINALADSKDEQGDN
jgi:hypothetical protein